jgi:hypothetical protein
MTETGSDEFIHRITSANHSDEIIFGTTHLVFAPDISLEAIKAIPETIVNIRYEDATDSALPTPSKSLPLTGIQFGPNMG